MQHTIEFKPSGRGQARGRPNPEYPHGMRMPAPPGVEKTCRIELPYPAPACGMFLVRCDICGRKTAVTTLGRADDLVSFEMPCGEEQP